MILTLYLLICLLVTIGRTALRAGASVRRTCTAYSTNGSLLADHVAWDTGVVVLDVAAAQEGEARLGTLGRAVGAVVKALDHIDGLAAPGDQLVAVFGLVVGELPDPVGGQRDVGQLVGLQVVAQLGDARVAALFGLLAPLAQGAASGCASAQLLVTEMRRSGSVSFCIHHQASGQGP